MKEFFFLYVFFVQTNHTRKELLFLMFLKINLRNHSSLHKIFYSFDTIEFAINNKERDLLLIMKFKKLIVGITVLAALVVTGCSKQQKKAQPILTKTQVINKSQKSFKSGQVKQSLTLGTDTSAQVITADTGFGGTPNRLPH